MTALEKELIEMYAVMLEGMQVPDAREIATGLVDTAVQQAKEGGTYDVPAGGGKAYLQSTDEGVRQTIAVKKEDGVTDEDILELWNMSGVERNMLRVVDNFFVMVMLNSFAEDGMDEATAAQQVKRYRPLYGDPRDEQHHAGVNRPLPEELRERVNKYTMANQKQIHKEALKYPSFNAFVRQKVKVGDL